MIYKADWHGAAFATSTSLHFDFQLYSAEILMLANDNEMYHLFTLLYCWDIFAFTSYKKVLVI